MKILVFLALLGTALHDAAAVTHSWKAFYTGSTGLNEFPEFVALNLLDDEVMGYFDSKTNRFEGKQSWVMENLGQEYVERQTNILRGHVQTFKSNVGILTERFNQSKASLSLSEDVHTVQMMIGCEWDDETKGLDGFWQYGYDGEDFIAFDLKTTTWIAPTPQAVITKHKWDNDKADTEYRKNYLTQICPEWVKKYVGYGRSSLMRTELPSVSLLQKTPSSPVSCLATGFYPHRASLVWRKDGEELHEEVDHGEILPNHDGTFQMSADLNLSSVTPEDWTRYDCVFQLSGVKEDKITKLDKAVIKTNEEKDNTTTIVIAAVVVIAVVLIAAVGVVAYKKKKANCTSPNDNKSNKSEQSDESELSKSEQKETLLKSPA